MKKDFVKCLLVLVFILTSTSCTMHKKVESDDEFAVEGESTTDTDAIGSDELGSSEGSDLAADEFDEKPVASEKAESSSGNLDATLENELNSLDEGASQKTAEQPKDELSLDEPTQPDPAKKDELSLDEPAKKDELSLDDPAQAKVAKTDAPPATPEVVTEPTPPPVVATEPVSPPVPPVAEVAPTPEATPVETAKMATIENVTYQANSNGGTIAISANQPLKFTTRLNSATNQFVVD